jgi:superfamily II DNA or RNA helicase
LGAESRKYYLPSEVEYRLALSATPNRWFDEEGTAAIRSFFGKTVFELPLAKAIGISLTPYYYYPILVELTMNELEEYRSLSSRIAQLMSSKDINDNDEQLTRLLIRRADLLNSAENKIPTISKMIDEQEDIHHTLFYCSPQIIDDVVHLIGWEKRIEIHRFTAHESAKQRQQLLADFASGKLRALAAMHCLDEGVDVPSTRTAYILASSSNPRQFIQRRGRVLRMAEGKENAIIYDLITTPPQPSYFDNESLKAEQSILRKELKRFSEFADCAINTQIAYEVIWGLAKRYGVLDF